MAQSFATNLHQANLMTQALKAVTTGGATLPAAISQQAVDELATLLAQVQTLDQAQERLKADLKAKTEALEAAYSKLKQQTAEMKKRVKLEYPQAQWREFGIDDKH